jgi:hypothetical protein
MASVIARAGEREEAIERIARNDCPVHGHLWDSHAQAPIYSV